MRPSGILETCLYARDLEAAESFYGRVLGLPLEGKAPGRHLFFRCGGQMLLVFDPQATRQPAKAGALPIPPHGAEGPGHVCFPADAATIGRWRDRLLAAGVTIEAEVDWPGGGRSLYFRDPAGNSLELAEPRIWGLS